MKLKGLFFFTLLLVFSGQLIAQDYLRSAYYTQSYRYRHLMNPSFQPDRGYVGVPILGYSSLSFSSDVAVSNLFSALSDNRLDQWNDFINSPYVESGFKSKNKFDVGMEMSLFNIGFFAFNGFNSIGYALKSTARGYFPKEVIDVLCKSPEDREDIHLSDLNFRSNTYMEIALGHSHSIGERITVGAKVKMLLGLMNVGATIDRMSFHASGDYWDVNGSGLIEFSGFLDIPTTSRYLSEVELSEVTIDRDNLISGFGLATDLGVNYDINDDWQVNLALLNVGFMRWNKSYHSSLDVNSWQFEGFDNFKDDDEEEVEEVLSSLWNSAKNCFRFKGVTEKSKKEFLSMTLNAGVQYTLPVYDKLKFGFLSSTKFNAGYTWFEGRLSANVAPSHWFDGALSLGLSNLGASLGLVADFHPADFSILIGTNLPLHSRLYPFDLSQKLIGDFYLGFNFPIGEKHKKEYVEMVESYYETQSDVEKMQEMEEMEQEPQNILIEE